jgi:hypothetical protein
MKRKGYPQEGAPSGTLAAFTRPVCFAEEGEEIFQFLMSVLSLSVFDNPDYESVGREAGISTNMPKIGAYIQSLIRFRWPFF